MTFSLPDNFIASTTQYAGQIVSSFGGLTALIIGTLLGVIVLTLLIEGIRGK